MTTESYLHLKDLVGKMLELPTEDRQAYMDSLRNSESASVIERVSAMAVMDDDSFLDKSLVVDLHADELLRIERGITGDPKHVGRYRITRRIGAGGAGTVYEATQDSPRRAVALKLLRNDAVSESLTRRFMREADLLAHLHHPAIAHVYEAGIVGLDNEQQPFIAMEFIPEAQSITSWANSQFLSREDRLELFITVCKAVEHAHGRGVIHRDIKPANILVDQAGNPKVIDFGVARLMDSFRPTEEQSIHTLAGDIIGTLMYMAPEQCTGRANQANEQADVYALGVVLFELLTGQLPLVLAGLSFPDAIDRISSFPSKRLLQIAPEMGDGLDAITSKALRKDPEDRYHSVAAFAADLRRYLDHQPVTAHPPGHLYYGRLFYRRHRTLVSAVWVIALVLIAATTMSSIFGIQANRSRRAEEAQLIRSSQVNRLLGQMLNLPNPHNGGGEETTVIQMLDLMTARLDSEPVLPDVEASVRSLIGNTYLHLFRLEEAKSQFTRSLELLSEIEAMQKERSMVFNSMGLVQTISRELQDARESFLAALSIRKRQGWTEDEDYAQIVGNLANIYINLEEWDLAEPCVRESIDLQIKALGEADFATLGSYRRLARIQKAQRHFDEAIVTLSRTLEIIKDSIEESHPIYGATLNELAAVQIAAEQFDSADTTLQLAWRICTENRPIGSPDWLYTYRRVARFWYDHDQPVKAIAETQFILAELRREFGGDDLRTTEGERILRDLVAGKPFPEFLSRLPGQRAHPPSLEQPDDAALKTNSGTNSETGIQISPHSKSEDNDQGPDEDH